jgi:hypothetical protein
MPWKKGMAAILTEKLASFGVVPESEQAIVSRMMHGDEVK